MKHLLSILLASFSLSLIAQPSSELYNWEGNYKDSIKIGIWKGTPKDTSITSYIHETYEYGQVISKYKWDLNDKLMSEELFAYSPTHKLAKLTLYYEEGGKRSEMNFSIPLDNPTLENGKYNATLIDTSKIWDLDGNISEETIYSDKNRLTKRFYYATGELLREEQYAITKRRVLKKDGTWTYRYKFEDTATLEIYKNNRLKETKQIKL